MSEDAPGRSAAAVQRLRDHMREHGREAVVLATPPAAEWLAGGLTLSVDRTAPLSECWFVVTTTDVHLLAADVEHERITTEWDLAAWGAGLVGYPWAEPNRRHQLVTEIAGVPAGRVAADVDGFGPRIADELTTLRLQLSPSEQMALRNLGRDTAHVLHRAIDAWTPGETDRAVAARVVSGLEAVGAQAPVLLVGGDERVARFRHPVQVGAPVHRLLMAVVVSRRHGLHVAATRYGVAGRPDPEWQRRMAVTEQVHADVLGACRPGRTYGDALDELARAYERAGFPDAWREHYQGGPIGFQQREFEIAPHQRSSSWYEQVIEPGQAVAWNPSVAGGAKAEDTFLITRQQPERLTPLAPPAPPTA